MKQKIDSHPTRRSAHSTPGRRPSRSTVCLLLQALSLKMPKPLRILATTMGGGLKVGF